MCNRRYFSLNRILVATVAVALLGACATPAPPTLYQRLGSEAGVTAVVDRFIDNAATDWRIAGRFARADVPRLKHELATQICAATGGPCTYTGRDMRSAHTGLHITEAEFGALLQDLAKALDRRRVPAADKKELLAILAAMKTEVVNR